MLTRKSGSLITMSEVINHIEDQKRFMRGYKIVYEYDSPDQFSAFGREIVDLFTRVEDVVSEVKRHPRYFTDEVRDRLSHIKSLRDRAAKDVIKYHERKSGFKY